MAKKATERRKKTKEDFLITKKLPADHPAAGHFCRRNTVHYGLEERKGLK